jgi:hypothetical protein
MIFGKTIGLEIVKRTVGSSVRIRKMSDWTLQRGRPLRNGKRYCTQIKTGAVGAPATIGNLPPPTERRIFIVCIMLCVMMWKRRMMIVKLDQLAPCDGTAQDEWPKEGSSRSSCRVIIVRSKPRGRKVRPIIDVTSTTLGKEEMAVHI